MIKAEVAEAQKVTLLKDVGWFLAPQDIPSTGTGRRCRRRRHHHQH